MHKRHGSYDPEKKTVFRYYYLDIETVPLDKYREEPYASLDPLRAKIITIQYQPLDTVTGRPLAKPNDT